MLGKKVSTDIKCYVFLQYFSYTSTQVFDYLLAEFVRVFVRVCYLAFDLSFIHLINCHIEGNDLFFFFCWKETGIFHLRKFTLSPVA